MDYTALFSAPMVRAVVIKLYGRPRDPYSWQATLALPDGTEETWASIRAYESPQRATEAIHHWRHSRYIKAMQRIDPLDPADRHGFTVTSIDFE